MDGEVPKAYVAVESYEGGIKVGNVRKAADAGFHMSELYKWLIDQHAALYSDTTQTPQGQKIWSFLRKDPDLNVVEYDAPGGMMWGWKADAKMKLILESLAHISPQRGLYLRCRLL